MPKTNDSRTLNHLYREVSLLSYLDRKIRCKKKTVNMCPPKGKKEKRRLRVIKKIVRVKCPPPEGRELLQELAGAIAEAGPQGLAGALGPRGLVGLVGAIGALGPGGLAGALGPQGLAGLAGAIGALGPEGLAGALGPQGIAGIAGAIGAAGLAGPAGATGPAGPAGPATGVLGFADFFALMPPDNAATVAPNTDVSFPQDGPISGTEITRLNASSFNLAEIGTYQVFFEVGVNEPGQLILTLNGADLAYTVVGRATGTTQIIGMALVQTSVINSVLTVRNPAGNAAALTITPLAGGTRPVSAHLVITQIA
ncbi:collagen-like protein [Paenibacillus sp. NPDC093718]|uniref:collagen-like protein n=1 Tax=Paenibacillus sp. NPDC093718 TaxID=3390601 RepID=UPI003CFD8802